MPTAPPSAPGLEWVAPGTHFHIWGRSSQPRHLATNCTEVSLQPHDDMYESVGVGANCGAFADGRCGPRTLLLHGARRPPLPALLPQRRLPVDFAIDLRDARRGAFAMSPASPRGCGVGVCNESSISAGGSGDADSTRTRGELRVPCINCEGGGRWRVMQTARS
jgi:hypothetical protein